MAYNSTVNYLNLVRHLADARYHVPDHIKSSFMGCAKSVYQSDLENKYSEPMVWIGIYIALASLCCILAMVADLLHGLRCRKLWIPCKYFTINAASLTVIAVAMKLPVDLTGPMPGVVDQLAKLGSMAFMCTMMANLLPSLATLDNNALLSNVIALGILVITLVVNVCIQIHTGVVLSNGGEAAKLFQMISTGEYVPKDFLFSNKVTCSTIAIIYSSLLFLLFIMHVCSSIVVLKANQIIELKHQVNLERASRDDQQSYGIPRAVKRLEQHLNFYWTMARSRHSQRIIPCSVITNASGVICAFTTILNTLSIKWAISDIMGGDYDSDYKWTTLLILVVQFIGVILSTVAPLSRFIASLSILSNIWSHIKVFRIEKLWTQKLYDWKYGSISFPFGSPKNNMIIINMKILILNFCIKFQEGVVVVCKIITLIPFFFIIFVLYCLRCLKWLLQPVFISSVKRTDIWEQPMWELEDDEESAWKTLEAPVQSLSQFIQKSEKKQPIYLMNLILGKTTLYFQGVKTFDKNDRPNCWSLPVVTLTTIVITLPNIEPMEVVYLYKSVREGLEYVVLVEKFFSDIDSYVRIHKAAERLWQEVEVCHKWLGIKLKDISSQSNTSTSHVDATLQIIQLFLKKAKAHVNEEMENESNFTSICAKSMSSITETIIDDTESHHRLFDILSSRIADIMAACLTNLPLVISMKCHASAKEKKEASVRSVAKLLCETKQIIHTLQDRVIPSMDLVDLPFIDKWRA